MVGLMQRQVEKPAPSGMRYASPAQSAGKVLEAPGAPLDPAARDVMEPRFGIDFSRVRVHTDSDAAQSARSLGASAYTVGQDIVFGQGRYDPVSGPGRRLLAHELVHTAQQSRSEPPRGGLEIGAAESIQEGEADRISAAALAGQRTPAPQPSHRMSLARFSDTTHHVIEEAALPAAGFDPRQVGAIEKGNIQRDYSQIGAAGNAALLGRAKGFGGYDPAEHFDNFIFDAVTNRWRTRGVGQNKFLHLDPKQPDPSPIDYITEQLTQLANAGMTEDSLVHLGNAFHTVEDFFAHSNFMELAKGDKQFGDDLVTGSFGDNPANSAVSLAHTLGGVSTPQMQQYYERQAEAQTQLTEPLSHSRLAKDTPSAAGFTEARRLAALVIQDLGTDIIGVMRSPHADPGTRVRMMNETVLTKIHRYLRPPDPKDPWWTGLGTHDAGAIDARLAEAERRTPVTVNQAPFSPLRNLEASKDSPMAIPFGVALPLGNRAWLQAGGGVTRPSILDPRLPDTGTPADERSTPLAGVQLTGRF